MTMQPRDVERVLNNVLVKTGPGVSEEGMRLVMFDVIDDFFDRSWAWYEYITVNLQANVVSYAIQPAHGGRIVRDLGAWNANNIAIPGGLAFGHQGGIPFVGPGPNIEPPGAIWSLVYPQTQAFPVAVLVVKSIILPTVRDVPDAPAWLLPQHGRYIEAGIIGRLQMIPKQPYTNGDGAKAHMAEFLDGCAMVKTQVQRAFKGGGQSWRYPGGWRTHTQRGGVSTAYPWIR